ncbi:glycosyltransferase [Clostridium minihomine]|uniref:glycosyltransferase n=1 Tax=Clostridium minihomine TaxID=2045012 RepID=UPI000C771CFF|nr:glycosyltransferase [Clostridium minihomine]
MNILYVTYIDFGDFKSGSSVRPQKMHEAFLALGCQVKLLQTQQNKRAERKKAVEEINRWLDATRPDFCYVESPSGPIFHGFDRKLLRRIHRMGIPMGYFYRDAAFRFDEIFIPGKKSLKQHVIHWMSERDIRFLKKNTDLVYLPTESMAKYFDFPKVAFLPPACTGSHDSKIGKVPGRRSIYVGGVSKRYGTDTLLKAFEQLNRGENGEYPLTLVCRQQAVSYIGEEYLHQPWLNVVHASGAKELAPLYAQADLALYPIEKNAYNDFAFSVKLMEYLEYGLPMVAVNCTETQKFIETYSLGLVCENNPEDFAEKVAQILGDSELYARCAESAVNAVEGNLWMDRAKTVLQDLGGDQGEAQV